MVIDSIGGEVSCSQCGYVVKEKIEESGPEWRAFSKEEKDDRSRTGRKYRYRWGDFDKVKFSADFVPSSAASLVNSWWRGNEELMLSIVSSGVSAVYSVQLEGGSSPFKSFVKPYTDLYRGIIDLETY